MDFIQMFLGMAGVGALVAAIVGALKQLGAISDGQSGNWSAGFSILGLVALFVMKIINPAFDFAGLDEKVGLIADLLVKIVAVAVQLGLPGLFYKLFKNGGVPLIGKSFSK